MPECCRMSRHIAPVCEVDESVRSQGTVPWMRSLLDGATRPRVRVRGIGSLRRSSAPAHAQSLRVFGRRSCWSGEVPKKRVVGAAAHCGPHLTRGLGGAVLRSPPAGLCPQDRASWRGVDGRLSLAATGGVVLRYGSLQRG